MDIPEYDVRALLHYGIGFKTSSDSSPKIEVGDLINFTRPYNEYDLRSIIKFEVIVDDVCLMFRGDDNFIVVQAQVTDLNTKTYVDGSSVLAAIMPERGALVMPSYKMGESIADFGPLMHDYRYSDKDMWPEAEYCLFDPNDPFSFIPTTRAYVDLLHAYLAQGISPLTAVTKILEINAVRE